MYIHTNHMVQTASRMYCLIGVFTFYAILFILFYIFIILYHQPLNQRFSDIGPARPRHMSLVRTINAHNDLDVIL